MKRLQLLFFTVFALFFYLVPASASVYDDQMATIHSMAGYLINNQNNDGGWDWTQPLDDGTGSPGDTDSSTGSTSNTAGATARGLVAAYNKTGNTDYLDAAVKTGKYIVDNTTTVTGAHKDSLFLNELDQAMVKAGLVNTYGGKTFAEHAKDSVDTAVTLFNSGTYTNKWGTTYNWDASGALEYDFMNAFDQIRGTGNDTQAGLTPWEVGEWAQALYEIDSTTYGTAASNLSDNLFTSVIGGDGIFGTADDGYTGPDNYGDWWWGLGLSGLLEGMATTGSDQGDIDKVVNQLSSMGTYDHFQIGGYYALAMELAGEKELAISAGLDIHNAFVSDGVSNGYSVVYLESLGEALHGLSNNPVPEPATLFLFGIGLLGIAGVSRRRKA